MTTHVALIIPANPEEPVRVETIDTSLESLQGPVEGLIEPVSDENWVAWFNEEGLILNLPANHRATKLVFAASGVITQMYFGNAVFLGETEEGDNTDVPPSLIELAAGLFPVAQPTT